jgi:predicted dehydrogenase
VRVLIAGLGAIGQRHARNLRAVLGDRADLLAYRTRRLRHVVTESLQRDDSRNVETDLGVRAFDDLDEALSHGPDAVFVCTPSSQHLRIAEAAVSARCHVFVEKPLSHTLDGADALVRAVHERGVVAMVGCQWRFHPCVRWLRDVVQSGVLGEIREAAIDYQEYLPDWHPYEDYRTSYAARANLGGGVVLTQIHDYDLAWWLFGDARTIAARGGHQSDLEIDVEDTVDVDLEMAVPVHIHQTFAARPPRRTIRIAASRGNVTVDLLAACVTTDVPGVTPPALHGYRRNEMFLDEVKHFVACVEKRETPIVPIEDGVAVLRIAMAVKEQVQ